MILAVLCYKSPRASYFTFWRARSLAINWWLSFLFQGNGRTVIVFARTFHCYASYCSLGNCRNFFFSIDKVKALFAVFYIAEAVFAIYYCSEEVLSQH